MGSVVEKQQRRRAVKDTDAARSKDDNVVVQTLDGRSGWPGVRPTQAESVQALKSLRAAATGTSVSRGSKAR
jgi:hypothetical protein